MAEADIIRVLVVEDEESFLKVLTRVLESTQRFVVYPCEAGDEAVAEMKRLSFDMVILDYKLPGMSGLNVLQWMYEQKMDTPVVMLTGAGSENIAVEAMKFGAYDYIRKEGFDRELFPVIVLGVYEQYLFKKDKERREARVRMIERDLTAFEILRNSLLSFAEDVSATLTKVTQLTDEAERSLQPLLPQQESEHLRISLEKIRDEYKTLAAVGRSIVSLSKVMSDNYLKMHNLHQSELKLVPKPEDRTEKPLSKT